MTKPVTLVTGATGFLGGRVCERLAYLGEPVVGLGRDASKFPVLPFDLFRPQVADLANAEALRDACRGVDTVIHSAAMSTAWGDPRAFHEANVEGTRRLLEAARDAGVRRFVHVSSSSVTFDNRDQRNIDESEPYASKFFSPYPESKAAAERVVRDFTGLETVILRPRAIFGPGDTALLPRLVRAGEAKWLRIIGTGENVQDLTYVDNVVHALVLARTALNAAGRTYYLSNDAPLKLWDVIFEVFDGLGIPRPTRKVPADAAILFAGALEAIAKLRRAGEPRLTRYTVALLARDQTLNISAAKLDLGYAPIVSMSDAVARTIDALRVKHG